MSGWDSRSDPRVFFRFRKKGSLVIMEMRMYRKLLGLFAVVVLLAGCETAPTSQAGGGGATTTLGQQTAVAPVGPAPG